MLFFTGAACVFLFAPFNLFPLLFLCIPAFFLILDAAPNARRAAWDGFFFGYGYFMAGTYWIAISLTVDAERFGWMIPLSVFGLSAVFAVYFLLFGYAYHRLKGTGFLSRLLMFCVLWVAIEYLRSIGIFGFPWNLLGYSLVPLVPLLQSASAVGAYGLSLLALLFSLAWVPYVRPEAGIRARRFTLVAKAALLLSLSYGIWHANVMAESGENPKLRVVQANIAQQMKWDASALSRILYTHRSLSQYESDAGVPDIVVWPETAIPMLLRDDSEWPPSVGAFLPQGATLVSGVVREKGERIYNAVIVMDAQGHIRGEYYKRQLVPFGEFVPFRSVLPLDRIAPGPRDFSPGEKPVLQIEGMAAFQPLVCYESIFPWLAHTHSPRPRWLLTITNDGWFGTSPGPYQHLAMGRVRAVEQGLPLVRAANTGISAVIDSHGRIIRSLGLNEQGVIDMALPPALPKTLYSKVGEALVITILLTMFLLALRYRNST